MRVQFGKYGAHASWTRSSGGMRVAPSVWRNAVEFENGVKVWGLSVFSGTNHIFLAVGRTRS